MEASTVTPVQDEAPVVADAERSRNDLFRYSAYVHVGEGADECDHITDGRECTNEDHFHAWCRLPNPFQVRDIQEKARAARARKIRHLQDPESDAHVILEQELDALRDPAVRDLMIEEILDKDFNANYDLAMHAVLDIDDPDHVPADDADGDEEVPKLYANIHQDQEEFARQQALPEEQRSEEFETLEKIVAGWSEAVDKAMKKIIEPQRARLKDRDTEDLMSLVRRERIATVGTDAYLHTFNTWQWYVCTYKVHKKAERVWADIAKFKYEAPSDVIGAIQRTFTELEKQLAGERAGKF